MLGGDCESHDAFLPMKTRFLSAKSLCAFVALGCFLFSKSTQAQSGSTQPVSLAQANDHVTVGNGIVSFEVVKTNGNIRDLKYGSVSILAEPGYLDWISGGNNHIGNGEFAVVTDPQKNGGEMCEVSITQKYAPGGKSPFDVELHYVLLRGDSGLYSFVVFSHAKDYPAGGIGQSRWVLRLDDKVFDFINVDEKRRRVMPPSNTPAKILGPKESSQFTEGPFKGFITDKYHFFVDVGDHFFHGWTSTQKHIGCWIVYGSNEAQNGGPTKQTNSAHFGRMLFKIITCGHYGGNTESVAAGQEWRKIYGPWMLYLNSGGNNDALWADAKKQAEKQRAAWPLAWMKHPEFPLAAMRGTVRGQLHIGDPQDAMTSPANAWVGLAAPEPDWQKQSNGYQFWVHADKDGSFVIPNVRAGDYTLYAFTDGVMDEFRHDGVKVEKGGAVNLGTLDWKPVRHGKQLWQIGKPDRTAKEFRHGDDYRQWGLWLKYPEEFPNGVNFEIGKSGECTDWNYAQVNVQKDGQWIGTKWNILFDMAQPPKSGTATLRIAFASTHNAKLTVFVNDQPVGGFRTAADNAMIRAGIHGQYSEEDFCFDAALLKPGRNTISLEQSAAGNVQKSVMYDCVRLELDDSQPFDKSKVVRRKRTAEPAAEKEAESAD
jgi:rhamnogalacturonan endolyase